MSGEPGSVRRDVAIVGKKHVVLPFSATGARVVFAAEGEARQKTEELLAQGAKVIFFAEEFTAELDDLLRRYRSAAFPCLVPFPTAHGTTRIAIDRVRGVIKRAVGADIFVEEK